MIDHKKIVEVIHNCMIAHARAFNIPFQTVGEWKDVGPNLREHAEKMFWLRVSNWRNGMDGNYNYNTYRAQMLEDGWRPGLTYDDEKKIHPRIGPWDKMTKENQMASDIIVRLYGLYIPELIRELEKINGDSEKSGFQFNGGNHSIYNNGN